MNTDDLIASWGLYEANESSLGRGVAAGTRIPADARVLYFKGPIYTKETCPEFSESIQVGLNEWMWSSGGLDDLVNHSCDPNCGLRQERLDGKLETYLIALRDVPMGEYLSFDYSTSMVGEPWDMECLCGSKACRGVIANFLDMPLAIQRSYAERDLLPEHVLHAYKLANAGVLTEQAKSVLQQEPRAESGSEGGSTPSERSDESDPDEASDKETPA